MQLIIQTEPTLAIEKDMSTVENIQNEKVGNGDIDDLNENNCNGNKENIGEVNVIFSDDINKQINEDEIDETNAPTEESNVMAIKVESIKTEVCDVNNPEADAQIAESQNGTLEQIYEISDNKNEIKDELEETEQENFSEDNSEDEDDIIRIKEEINPQPKKVLDKESDTLALGNHNSTPENANLALEKDIPEEEDLASKDDVEFIEPTPDTPIISTTETTTIVDLEANTVIAESCDKNDIQSENNKNKDETLNNDNSKAISKEDEDNSSPIELKDDMDVEEVDEEKQSNNENTLTQVNDTAVVNTNIDKPICKLSFTLDILSDEEDEPPSEVAPKAVESNEKQCINIEDDDDIMLIDEDACKTETAKPVDTSIKEETPIKLDDKTIDSETGEKAVETENKDLFAMSSQTESSVPPDNKNSSFQINISEKEEKNEVEKVELEVPLLPDHFLKTAKNNLSDMTRGDLEEFCILKIVESIVDRSNLTEFKNKLKSMAQVLEEQKKKALAISKQNRDLQVVLKSVQEEQKKMPPDSNIAPLKITRSVGLQVSMDKNRLEKNPLPPLRNTNNNVANRPNAKINPPPQSPRPQKVASNQPIPVPRLVPAHNTAIKTPSQPIPQVLQTTPIKAATPIPNGIKNLSPSQKVAEKRQHNRIMSVTVDLTDDEPPTKINNRTSPAPPVRLVPSQNLMANSRPPFSTTVNSPRKVYIPISGPQGPNIRAAQTIMLKTVPTPALRHRTPTPQMTRGPSSAVRITRIPNGRHPAPLPDGMKQYQPPNWKALPPAPDLKLSKVENGIVISWKIEGYQEDSYEKIASYQLYAYQETASPPSTALWKKIGDVKALPLPMACTLTQFMAGFKYYFAVRAVDVRSRLGPFSLPGSILLLNKL